MPFLGILGGAGLGVVGVALGATTFRLLTLRNPKPALWLGTLSVMLSFGAAEYIWFCSFGWFFFGPGAASQPMTDGQSITLYYYWMFSAPVVGILAAVFGSGVGQGFRGQ